MRNEKAIVLSKAQAELYTTYMNKYNQNQAIALDLVYVMAGNIDALVKTYAAREAAKKLAIPEKKILLPN